MLHTKTDKGYIIRFERGEEVVSTLTAFVKEQGVEAADFHAIGAVENLQIGSYDLPTKEYDKRDIDGILEAVSVIGNVALVDGEQFLHVHGVFSDPELHCIGGHVFSMDTAVTLEVFLNPHDTTIVRELDENIGLKLCTFPNN